MNAKLILNPWWVGYPLGEHQCYECDAACGGSQNLDAYAWRWRGTPLVVLCSFCHHAYLVKYPSGIARTDDKKHAADVF
jgi:hypothetical protein